MIMFSGCLTGLVTTLLITSPSLQTIVFCQLAHAILQIVSWSLSLLTVDC